VKRGARFLLLDPKNPENADADWVILEVPFDQLRPLIDQLEAGAAYAGQRESRMMLRAKREPEWWSVRVPVEARHPKAGSGDSACPPSLLKDSIPRAGRS